MKEFIRSCAERVGILEPVVAPVCDHLSDFVCQYTDGSLKLNDYVPSSILGIADDILNWSYENPWAATRHALSFMVAGLYMYNELKHNKPLSTALSYDAIYGKKAKSEDSISPVFMTAKSKASATSFDSLFQGSDFYSMGLSSSANLFDFKDNVEVSALIKIYEKAYIDKYGIESRLGETNRRPILKLQNGGAFQAVTHVTVDASQPEKQNISESLNDWLMNMLAFYIVTNQTVLPPEFSTMMMVNHSNVHWTVLNGSFKTNEATQCFFQEAKRRYSNVFSYQDDTIIDNYLDINKAKNVLATLLSEPSTPALSFKSIDLVHLDSMNHNACHELVERSLSTFKAFFDNAEYYFDEVPQQLGNTCADHAVYMGMSTSLFDVPVVEADSTALRELTEAVHSRVATQRVLEEEYQSFSEFEVLQEDAAQVKRLLKI